MNGTVRGKSSILSKVLFILLATITISIVSTIWVLVRLEQPQQNEAQQEIGMRQHQNNRPWGPILEVARTKKKGRTSIKKKLEVGQFIPI